MSPDPTTPPFAVHGGGHTLRYARLCGVSFLALLLVGGGVRLAIEHREAQALEVRTQDSLLRSVATVQAREGDATRNVVLTATLRGSSEAILHARSGGYLAAWHKTIGDKVRKGDLLATIEAPEQEQELAQLRAAREQIQVRLTLARQTLERWEALRLLDSVAQQDLDEKRSAVAQGEADLAAAVANVRRLEQMKAFRRIVAPFDGIITRRNVDVGDLISANGKELFSLVRTDPLQVSLWVPQVYASEIRQGQEVDIRVPERRGERLRAKVAHLAGALDPLTRTRQVDIVLPNPDGALIPGAYAEVALKLASGLPSVLVPNGVLQTGKDGPRVFVVDAENRVSIRAVEIGRDLGREIEVLSGIAAGEVLVSSPSDLLVDGEVVNPRALASAQPAPPAAGRPAVGRAPSPQGAPG
ncbi:MAG: efflux RND transporter periplasmic adaptor subunit [Azoarcus sp.]|nr:efflux RND transporter periplasmic adaptor subunit [Azoarcus sp.]